MTDSGPTETTSYNETTPAGMPDYQLTRTDMPSQNWHWGNAAAGSLHAPPPPISFGHHCYGNTHYFTCKHERVCECGLTARFPIAVSEGL